MPRRVRSDLETHCRNGHAWVEGLLDRNGYRRCRACAAEGTRRFREKHGIEYSAWSSMKQRCQNPKHPEFFRYGARSIRVCERWSSSFEDFLSDVGERPSPKLSLDRFPNKDGNYEPGNVRWATRKEQAKNRNPKGTFKRPLLKRSRADIKKEIK